MSVRDYFIVAAMLSTPWFGATTAARAQQATGSLDRLFEVLDPEGINFGGPHFPSAQRMTFEYDIGSHHHSFALDVNHVGAAHSLASYFMSGITPGVTARKVTVEDVSSTNTIVYRLFDGTNLSIDVTVDGVAFASGAKVPLYHAQPGLSVQGRPLGKAMILETSGRLLGGFSDLQTTLITSPDVFRAELYAANTVATAARAARANPASPLNQEVTSTVINADGVVVWATPSPSPSQLLNVWFPVITIPTPSPPAPR